MIIITVEDVKSFTEQAIFQEETSCSFSKKPQLGTLLYGNHNANSCLNKENIVTYSERFARFERRVAKGGDDLLSFMSKSLSQKLDEIATIWKTQYPIDEMLGGRTPARRSVFRYVGLKAKLQLCNKTKFCKQKNEIL